MPLLNLGEPKAQQPTLSEMAVNQMSDSERSQLSVILDGKVSLLLY
jgi:hypothetical protein